MSANLEHEVAHFVPKPSVWPFIGCSGLFLLLLGAGHWLHYDWFGPYLFFLGTSTIVLMSTTWPNPASTIP